MSVLYREGTDDIRCADYISPDPVRRSDKCAYRATHIALPLEKPVCQDHYVDYPRARSITAFDVARAQCADCLAVQQGERERRQERRGVKGENVPSARSRDERWCERHDSEAFARWQQEQAER